jgi:hypothetical protein
MHSGFERRITPRHRSLKTGVIALSQGSSVQCRIWDFSPAGVGLILLDADNVPAEFDLSFDYATRHCVTVWRAFNRIGLKYRSPAMSRVLSTIKPRGLPRRRWERSAKEPGRWTR